MALFKKRPTMAIIHCSATSEGMNFGAEDINRWHLNKGWAGIGYHIVIKLDGTVEELLPNMNFREFDAGLTLARVKIKGPK